MIKNSCNFAPEYYRIKETNNLKMKKLYVWILATVLVCSYSFTAVSCSDDDISYQEVTGEFSSTDVNRLIDENYAEVKQKGYAKLVIPAKMYRKGMFTFPANATSDMEAMVNAGYKVYVNGGTVRDGIMGKEAHDVDFTTDADIMKIKDVLNPSMPSVISGWPRPITAMSLRLTSPPCSPSSQN